MTVLKNFTALVVVIVLAAFLAPSALAAEGLVGINPELIFPNQSGPTYDGPPMPAAFFARYIMFPTNAQKRFLANSDFSGEQPEIGDSQTNAVTGDTGTFQPGKVPGARAKNLGFRGAAVPTTPIRSGVAHQSATGIVDDLEDVLRDAQGELGLN